MIYFCCDERRRSAIKVHATLNGIDFLEVVDDPTLPFEQRQRTLLVHFLKDLAPDALKTENVRIDGGERIQNIQVVAVTVGVVASPPTSSPPTLQENVLVVDVAEPGDFSTYTLRLVQDDNNLQPPAGFDSLLSAIDFSFKVACDSDFDCQQTPACPPELISQPDINYLAKDYGSFRQLMLDRMSAILPTWKERNPADLGVTLVELLAYVADRLSYQQDAVATEAYLGTARRRVSVRRHARLVDYFIHDGSSARVWVHVQVRDDVNGLILKRKPDQHPTKLLTQLDDQPSIIAFGGPVFEKAIAARPEVFELLHDLTLFAAHNEMFFYTWGARECCLPKGATRATLQDSYPNLKPGDVLILQEVRGPRTGETTDADPTHRHAVRLTKVTLSSDPVGGQFLDPPTDNPVEVTEIEWHLADALPFALCISAREDTAYFDRVSVTLGNIVLADHGLTIENEFLGTVPPPKAELTKVPAINDVDRCAERVVELTPVRFRPRLQQALLSQTVPYNESNPPASANAAMRWSTRLLLPAITLREQGRSELWQPQRDLLNSDAEAREFVAEVENDGTAYLRFGDDQFGLRPATAATLFATYRVGNGVRGNVGAEALAHLVSDDPAIVTELDNPAIVAVRNPLPALGGSEPESLEYVRQNAPQAFRVQERAVTPADYAVMTKRCDLGIQRAAATLRWTGSWCTVFVTVDRFGGEKVDDKFARQLRSCLERYRMAGHDLEIGGPQPVSMEIEMRVCVKSGYFASDVKTALLDVFSSRMLPDGRRGVFHPDNFTFGQTVYLSPLYATAQGVAGVDSVEVTKFQRQGTDSDDALNSGKLELARLEIARLDNDANFPDHGVFNLIIKGGR